MYGFRMQKDSPWQFCHQAGNRTKNWAGNRTGTWLCHASWLLLYDVSNWFKTEYKDEVLEYLENVGFTHLQSTADMANSYLKEFQPDIEYLDYLLGYTLAWIKGNGEIDKIPRVFFSDNLYICNDTPEDKFYTTLVFDIQWNDNKQLLNKALEYAQEFNWTIRICKVYVYQWIKGYCNRISQLVLWSWRLLLCTTSVSERI